jgi:hypothetical protein
MSYESYIDIHFRMLGFAVSLERVLTRSIEQDRWHKVGALLYQLNNLHRAILIGDRVAMAPVEADYTKHVFDAPASKNELLTPDAEAKVMTSLWTIEEARELCTLINSVSYEFNCHPALTGGLLYKDGPRKDCDVVIYQRGDTKGVHTRIDWEGLWKALDVLGIEKLYDFGYCKKCMWKGKSVDILDPTEDGSDYNAQPDEVDVLIGEG